MPEDKTGLDRSGLIALMDQSFGEVTRKVGRQEVCKTLEPVCLIGEYNSLRIRTTGDYEAVIALTAEKIFFREMADAMKRGGNAEETEIEIYAIEYFNIFCGCFLSRLNSCLHVRARFEVPRFAEEEFVRRADEESEKNRANLQVFYRSSDSILRLDGLRLPCSCPD